MRTNIARILPPVRTEGGAPAYPHLTPIQQLRRTVLACLLWEDGYYENGVTVADRIKDLAAKCSVDDLCKLAIEARTEQHLRHVPLLLCVEIIKHGKGKIVADTITAVIQRADEMGELIALYWRNGKVPLSAQMKRGLARSFQKFDAYQLAKYGGRN